MGCSRNLSRHSPEQHAAINKIRQHKGSGASQPMYSKTCVERAVLIRLPCTGYTKTSTKGCVNLTLKP